MTAFHTHVFRTMGTDASVVLPDTDRQLVASVVDLFAHWDAALSRFSPDSELSRLNAAAGHPFVASNLLLTVAEAGLRAAQATDGIFDPTLEPWMRAIGYDRTFSDVPTDGPAVTSLGPAGLWRKVVVDRASRTILLPAGAGLDLGGIAKGMAVDAAIALLSGQGVKAALVEAGGDVAVLGLPANEAAWPIAVGTRVVSVPRGGMATSGTDKRAWTRGGRRVSHLIDPRTGDSVVSDLQNLTAVAASCEQAEVAAKVALILGSAVGTVFLEGRGISALLTDHDGREWFVGPWADQAGVAA